MGGDFEGARTFCYPGRGSDASGTAAHAAFWREAEMAAGRLGIEAKAAGIHDAAETEQAIKALSDKPLTTGLVALPHTVTEVNRDLIVALATRYRLPSVHAFRAAPLAGALASYGVDPEDHVGRAADYVDRILRGAKPSDLPVQAATKFELVLNLKTAKALGLAIPQSFVLRADQVIE
ncbi:MAG: hypothetical protein JO058_25355 [Alphaproteobacteria bacterium]|nr:hypothetical protein [Alphaproteobacteria bacterium]